MFDAVKANTVGRLDLEKSMLAITEDERKRTSPIERAPHLVGKNVGTVLWRFHPKTDLDGVVSAICHGVAYSSNRALL